jgi:Tfp pilus assembly protein PilX
MNKKGIALVLGLIVILVLSVLGSAAVSRSISETRINKRYLDSTQAFWLAEAGANQALKSLRTNYALTSIAATNLGPGYFSADIAHNADDSRTVTAHGVVSASGVIQAERIIEATMIKVPNVPADFYDNAIYCAANVVLNGNSFDVIGSVKYAGSISGNTSRIAGSVTHDASISPLARLNFEQLRTLSQAQGNYHDASQLNGPFPTSFWYNQAAGIPNVVFLEGNLNLKGKTHAGGLFVVGGEFIYDATLSGNVDVDGVIYTLGRFTINGGGNSLNVDGGIWSGQQSTLNGNPKVTYNA